MKEVQGLTEEGKEKFHRFLRQVQDKLGKSPSADAYPKLLDQYPLLPNQCLYVYDFKRGEVVYSRNEEALGLKPGEFNNEQVLAFHPDEQNLIMAISRIGIEAGIQGFSEPGEYALNITYRLRLPDHSYIKVLRQTRVLEVDEQERMTTNLSLLTRIDFLDTAQRVQWSFTTPLIDDSKVHEMIREELSGLFSKREIELIRAIATGKTSREIAEEWSVSKHTVDTHRRNTLRKAGSTNSIELIAFAREIGLLS